MFAHGAIEEVEALLAMKLDPSLPGARFSLGVAYRRLGRFADAEAACDALAILDQIRDRLGVRPTGV